MSKDSSDNGAATSACPKKKKFDPRPLELYRRRMRARERRERERDPALACRVWEETAA